MTQEFDITKMIPRESPKPKPKEPFPDLSSFTKRMIRKHYPELEHKLIRD